MQTHADASDRTAVTTSTRRCRWQTPMARDLGTSQSPVIIMSTDEYNGQWEAGRYVKQVGM